MEPLTQSFYNILIFFAFFILIFFTLAKRTRYGKNYPPGPMGLPVIGNLIQMAHGGSPEEVCTKWGQKYGPIISVKFGLYPAVIINDCKMIREALRNPNFEGKPQNKVFKAVFSGDYGLFLKSGETWKEQNNFFRNYLKDFGTGKSELEILILKALNKLIEELKREEGKGINMREKITTNISLKIIWQVLRGEKEEDEDKKEIMAANDVLQNVYEQIDRCFIKSIISFIPIWSVIAPERSGWNALVKARAKLDDMCEKVVAQRLENNYENLHTKDFIGAYIKKIQETTDEKSTFFGQVGFKTLGGVMSELLLSVGEAIPSVCDWAILYLTYYQEIQRKFQSEMDSVVGRNKTPTLADKSRMPYTDALILEIIRCGSIARLSVFRAALQDTVFYGYTIPKGTYVIPNLHAVNTSEDVWGDPMNFRPERFLSPDGKTVIPKLEVNAAFGGGKRKCPGENLTRVELFLILTSLFQRFEFKFDPTQGNVRLDPYLKTTYKPYPYRVTLTDRFTSQ